MLKIYYCNKCHKEAYRVQTDEKSVTIIVNGRVFLKADKGFSIQGNSTMDAAGHKVKLEI